MTTTYTTSVAFRKFILIILVLFVVSCGKQNNPAKAVILNGLTMGTTYTVKINPREVNKDTLAIKKSIDDMLVNINGIMSTYLPDSELSEFNRMNTTDWVKVSDELFGVIKTGIEVSEASDGAFDITVGPLVNLWGFGPANKNNTIPDDTSIQTALANVGFRHLHLDSKNRSIKKDLPHMYIDLSGIAKGYAVDRVASLLEEKYSITDYMVEIGGEIKTRGVKPGGDAWHIAIEMPVHGERIAGQIIKLENEGMATSGDYRNYFEINGIDYSHAIDPGTGKPIIHQLESVTVIHPQCMIADAWATALLVAGPEAGIILANRQRLPALFIYKDKNNFNQQASDNFKPYLHE